jgi:hypothetical protein
MAVIEPFEFIAMYPGNDRAPWSGRTLENGARQGQIATVG